MHKRTSRRLLGNKARRLLFSCLALGSCGPGRISESTNGAAGVDVPPPSAVFDAGLTARAADDAATDAGVDAGHPLPSRQACETAPRAPLQAAGLPRIPMPDTADDDAGTPADPMPQLTDGPIVGATTSHSATFWVRSDGAADWAVRIWPKDAPDQARRIYGASIQRDTDYVAVLEVAGLKPSTAYAYRVELGAPRASLVTLDDRSGELRTLAPLGARGKLRVALGADIGTQLKQPIFEQIRAVQPDLLLLLGDNVYADEMGVDFASYAQAYVNGWQIRDLAELLRVVPSFMIWDDHEIVDNFAPGSSPRYVPARQAYELFVNARNPAPVRPGTLYYTFDAGDVSFFVLDERSHRSPEDQADGPDKTMLGSDQKQALLAWLRCSNARLKVIASSVTFSDWGSTGTDSWAGYANEREEIFSFIAAHAIDDVLLVSGDQHWSAVFRYERAGYRFYEFMPTPLSKSRRFAPADATPEILARDEDHFVFGVLDIDTQLTPAHIDITLCAGGKPCDPGREAEPTTGLNVQGAQDNVPFTIHLTADDLGVRAAQ